MPAPSTPAHFRAPNPGTAISFLAFPPAGGAAAQVALPGFVFVALGAVTAARRA